MISTPVTDAQQQQCLEIWRDAFHVDDRWSAEFQSRVGWNLVRRIEHQGQVGAAAVVHPFGQYFGGKSLGCAGLALVACAPQFRSRGLTRGLLTEILREQHRARVPLSALYPSTRTLYRKLGYETAGAIFRYSVPLDRIRVRAERGELRPIVESDRPAVHRVYRDWAVTQPGLLERNDFLWRRVEVARDGTTRRGYLALIGGEARGYVYHHRGEGKDGRRTVEAWDMVALDADAGRLLLSYMADLRTTNDDLVFWGAANDPFLMLLDEQRFDVTLNAYWMLRILDVEQALRERGYNEAVDAQLELKIVGDGIIESNNANYVIQVKDGRGDVARGGRGTIKVSIRGLAPLFAGHLAPADLARSGLLTCSDQRAVQAAEVIFAAPQPLLADAF
jgi:predicted acetyltransferase